MKMDVEKTVYNKTLNTFTGTVTQRLFAIMQLRHCSLALQGNLVFDKIKIAMSKGFWHALAVIIVMLLAGPEIMVSIELMAMVEVLGASTFVLMYLSGIKLFFSKVWDKYKNFEKHSVFFFPTFPVLKKMPSLIVHSIPERTVVIGLLTFITVAMIIFYIQFLI